MAMIAPPLPISSESQTSPFYQLRWPLIELIEWLTCSGITRFLFTNLNLIDLLPVSWTCPFSSLVFLNTFPAADMSWVFLHSALQFLTVLLFFFNQNRFIRLLPLKSWTFFIDGIVGGLTSTSMINGPSFSWKIRWRTMPILENDKLGKL